MIKLHVILPFPYCYCLRILSPLQRVECWPRGGGVRSCVFLGRSDWVMMLDRGTVSVLQASCSSTEGLEKYKRRGTVVRLEILLHATYYPSLHRKILVCRQATFYSHHRFRWKYALKLHNRTVFPSTNSLATSPIFLVAACSISLCVVVASVPDNTQPLP